MRYLGWYGVLQNLDKFAKMRGKRSKQYRKLMQSYGMTFGFREPYQVLSMFHEAYTPFANLKAGNLGYWANERFLQLMRK